MGAHTIGTQRFDNTGFVGQWSPNANAARKFNNDYFRNVLVNGWQPAEASDPNSETTSPCGKRKYWVTADGTEKNPKSPHMMLNTDICMAFGTQNNEGLNHKASTGYQPQVRDDSGNTIMTIQAEMTGNRCCAWTNVRQFDKHKQKEHPVFLEAVANADGSSYSLQRGQHCGRDYQSGIAKWACCRETKHDDGEYDQDCSDSSSPNGPAMSYMHSYALDDSKFINYFRQAWAKGTTLGWEGQLRCCSYRRQLDDDMPESVIASTPFLQKLFQGSCVRGFQQTLPTDPEQLNINLLVEVTPWNSANFNSADAMLQSTSEENMGKTAVTVQHSKGVEFVFGASSDNCDGSLIGRQATSPFRKIQGWCESCKTYTVLMSGSECPRLGEALQVKRDAGSDEFGLAKEETSFSAYPFYCSRMSQNWDPDFDTYYGPESVQLKPEGDSLGRRRLDEISYPGEDKMIVVLQTEGDEPVDGDRMLFEEVQYVDPQGEDTWYYWVIGTLAILCFLLLVALIAFFVYYKKHKGKQPIRYVQRTGSMNGGNRRSFNKGGNQYASEKAMAPNNV
jgi:hypothetical protein